MPQSSVDDVSIIAQTMGHRSEPNATKGHTFYDLNVPLKPRLPWMDNRRGVKRGSFNKTASQPPSASDDQTTLLPMSTVDPRASASSSTPVSTLQKIGTTTRRGLCSGTVLQKRNVLTPREADDLGPRAEPHTGRGTRMMPKCPTKKVDQPGRTDRTPLVDITKLKRKHSYNDDKSPFKGPDSPTKDINSTDSSPELDTSSLTNAIKRLEGLMQEAENLCNEAANDNNGAISHVDASQILPTSRLDPGLNFKIIPAASRHPFLVDSTMSDSSLDGGADNHYSTTPSYDYQPLTKQPIVRDFAYRLGTRSNELYNGTIHDGATRPTWPANKVRSGQVDGVKDATPAGICQASDGNDNTPISPLSPRAGAPRQHKKGVQSTENLSRAGTQHTPRRNTYFDPTWQPEFSASSIPLKPSTSPIPWNEQIRRRRAPPLSNLQEGVADRDIEKLELVQDTNVITNPRRHWRLGHAKVLTIARDWSRFRKRTSALVACANTGIVGYEIGVYAGMVPRIQYQLADMKHQVILGNVLMFIGLALTTLICWPLPLLHGRRGYILASLGLTIPLQFPQAIIVASQRSPTIMGFELGLLTCRFLTGILVGLTNINDFATLMDLFGASLQSSHPHQETVQYEDPRREGGGIGMWLGIWAWCWVGSVSVGFLSGSWIISLHNPTIGYYITMAFLVFVLILNVMAPETRPASLQRTLRDVRPGGEHADLGEPHTAPTTRVVARGEIRLHISDTGPRYWIQEVWAGLVLSKRMLFQPGFAVLSLYLGWLYGQNVLIIVLLGALLSRSYSLPANYVGYGVLAVAAGALLAIPMTHAGLLSSARKRGPRSDDTTFEPQFTWSSHMARRIVFMVMLPLAGLIYTFVSPGVGVHYSIPIIFAGAIGFFDSLAVAECYGLIMETFDTCDLQPGANSRHRLESLPDNMRKRRTTYSSFPRVSAGIFVSQAIGFLCAAAATGVGGVLTRRLGPQYSTGITAGILMCLTILLTLVLWRFKTVQVVPDHILDAQTATAPLNAPTAAAAAAAAAAASSSDFWQPVVIGAPSGKNRRMSLLELGRMSRWSEIRRLNKLA